MFTALRINIERKKTSNCHRIIQLLNDIADLLFKDKCRGFLFGVCYMNVHAFITQLFDEWGNVCVLRNN